MGPLPGTELVTCPPHGLISWPFRAAHFEVPLSKLTMAYPLRTLGEIVFWFLVLS